MGEQGDQEGAPPRHRPVVAVVDDDELIRTILRRFLVRMFDAEVIDGSSAGDAIDVRFGTPAPDLMIVNGHMRGVDGVEAIRVIRALEASRAAGRMRIVISTADPQMSVAAMRAGADAELLRPFDAKDVRRLSRFLDPGGGAGE